MARFSDYRPSSSQDTVQHKRKYHVFLSFLDSDTGKSIVDHLFQSLSAVGFSVFLDTERLDKGENIEISPEDAIRCSTIHIPIFSSNYASSPWCLRRLSFIWSYKSMHQETQIIPLFYAVEPSVVRHQMGTYAESLKELSAEGRYSQEETEKWKEALYNVCDLSGWSLSLTAAGYEGKLVKRVVVDLLRTLKIDEMSIAKHPVGLLDPMKRVTELLDIDNNDIHSLSVGILGMGGLGKTTLSKALYNDVRHQFEAWCFVSNIRAIASASVKGLVKLQRQILRDLVKVDKDLNDIDRGRIAMETHLPSKKVLVILDDVDDAKQLDALGVDCYGPGSRIIITTRDAKVLQRGKIDNYKIHHMKGLSEDQGVQLFSWHAFLRDCPESPYKDITKDIVNACQGVPLALEILGAHLYDERRMEIWREALSKIPEEVHPSLKISYDALSREAQQMFLDIACFFVVISNEYLYGTTFYHDFWKALGYKAVHTSLASLEEKSLIRIDDSGSHCRFWMHDHLRDLGRQIVENEFPDDPSKRSRLWCKEDILSVLQHTEEMPKVRGLMMIELELPQMDNVALMHNLKFLFCERLRLGKEIKMLPRDLRCLVLSSCQLIGESLGKYFSLPPLPESLVHIKLEAFRLQELSITSQMIKLETLHVCRGYSQLPELKWMQSLRELTLSKCHDLKELPPLPESLVHIKVESCDELQKLSKLNGMQSLRELTLSCCKDLEELPPLPESLVHIKVERCSRLQKLSSMSHMIKLETLHVCKCESFAQLRELNWMQSLRELTLEYLVKLEDLPPLPESLVHIKVTSCGRLQKLSSMSHMIKLETLHVSECYTQLPELNWMQSLRELTLEFCGNLEELPPLPETLVHIKVERCGRLQKLSRMSHMIKLETLHVSKCCSLAQLPELNSMQSLRELTLSYCENLKHLPPLPKGLLKLTLDGCKNLKELPPLPEGLINSAS